MLIQTSPRDITKESHLSINSNPPTYPLCDKYDIKRTYKMEWGMVANADQVETVLEVLDTRLRELEALLYKLDRREEEAASFPWSSTLDKPLEFIKVPASDKMTIKELLFRDLDSIMRTALNISDRVQLL